jgi:hypothetical protein
MFNPANSLARFCVSNNASLHIRARHDKLHLQACLAGHEHCVQYLGAHKPHWWVKRALLPSDKVTCANAFDMYIERGTRSYDLEGHTAPAGVSV